MAGGVAEQRKGAAVAAGRSEISMASAAWETEHGWSRRLVSISHGGIGRVFTNCDEPPAKLELEGSRLRLDPAGLTRLPDQEPVHWIIRG